VASLSQGRTAAAQCGLFTHKSVPVIFEPPCILKSYLMILIIWHFTPCRLVNSSRLSQCLQCLSNVGYS